MASIWKEMQSEIKKVSCECCDSNEVDIYVFEDELYCEACLTNMEYYEEDYREECLTLIQRN